MVASAMRQ